MERDDENTIVIEILNRMWYFYKDGLKAVKERDSSNKFKVLYRGSENNFTFVGYKGKYYGAVFLENKYFLYMEENNKIFIICQVKDIASIPRALNEIQSAF